MACNSRLQLAVELLPNEVWLNIISLAQSMHEIHNITIMKPELFTLFLHEFDPAKDNLESLYFSDLAAHQSERLLEASSSCAYNKDTVYLHEICQRRPSDTYGRENHGIYGYIADEFCTINNRDFQKYYHSEEHLAKPLYYAFSIKGHLNVSNATDKNDNNIGSYRFLWNVKSPELFTFPELSSLMIYNEILKPSSIYDISANLNPHVFPKLKYIQINSVSRDSPVWIQDCCLPSLETLSIRWGILTNYTNVDVPNLKELDVSMISSPDPQYVEIPDSKYNIPFLQLDDDRPLSLQLEEGTVSYQNPSFHSNSKFHHLTRFQVIIFDTFHNSLNAYFLYFLDNITTMQELENLRMDLWHLHKKPTFSDQKNRSIDALIQIAKWKLMQKLGTINLNDGSNKLTKLHIHAPQDSQFLDNELICKFANHTNIEDMSLLSIALNQDVSFAKLSSLRIVFFKYNALSGFIALRSEKLKTFLIEIDIMKPKAPLLTNDDDDNSQTSLIEHLESFNENTPNLKALSLTFNYTTHNSLACEHLWNTAKYDLFSTPLTLSAVSNLSLNLTFAQTLKFFDKCQLLSLPNLNVFMLQCELRTCYDLVNPSAETVELLEKVMPPRIAINAPTLKKLILNLSNQCDLHPEYHDQLLQVEDLFETLQIDYYPLLFKICYNRDDDMLFKKISLDSRNKDNVVLKASEYDDCEYYEGEELGLDDEIDSEWEEDSEDEMEPSVELEYRDT